MLQTGPLMVGQATAPDHRLDHLLGSSFGGSSSCGPLKSNGAPDMRFKAN